MARAYALRRPVTNTYLVRERDRRRLRELGWVLLVVLPVGLCGLAYVWLRLEVLFAGYRIHGHEQELQRYLQEERRLGVEMIRSAHPVAVEQRAIDELGMQVPTADQIVRLEDRR